MLLRRRDLWPFLAFGGARASPPQNGAALLLRLADRKLVSVTGPDIAATLLSPPGSTLKPITLWCLLNSGKLKSSDEYLCPGTLVLDGRNMTCSHPRIAMPMNTSRALAYSCNCAVAHFARRLEPGELIRFCERAGLGSTTGLRSHPSLQQLQLQALGEAFIEVTPLELLSAYTQLAHRANDPQLTPVLEGLEGAVEYGTAQVSRLNNIRVAGKTGSVRDASGMHLAWFCGFAPSRSPEVALTVVVQGRSGAGDAAPVAKQLLQTYFASRA